MHNEIYSDGIGEITVSGSVVRIDLVSLSPTERDASNNPKRVFCQRIVMPLESFAGSAELMQQALQGLIQSGAITRAASSVTSMKPPALPGTTEARTVRDGHSNASPNFN